jgi:sphingomyelin phosphodiesterase acid-like 3
MWGIHLHRQNVLFFVRLLTTRRTPSLSMALLLPLLFSATCAVASPKVSRHQFLLASDLHFNPMADPALVPELSMAPPTQWESILRHSQLTTYSRYGFDANWWLLASALDQMRLTLPHPAFIMITGDILAHDFPKTFTDATHDNDRDHYRAFVLKTVEFMALEVRKRFGNTPVLLTIGNNDEECGNYSVRPGGIFLGDTAELARALAHGDDTFITEWKALGSYNLPHPTIPRLRILSLNTVFFSYRYHAAMFSEGCATVPSSGGRDLLNWLESNLAKAQADNDKVWLMFHIPPGIDGYLSLLKYMSLAKEGTLSGATLCSKAIVPMWVPTWTAEFDDLLEKYHTTILAGFAGHTHTDDFRLIGAAGTSQEFILIDPPISPIYGQNPGFRIVHFKDDGTLTDQTTYYLTNLSEASTTVPGEWRREYTFSRRWKTKGLDSASLQSVYDQVASQPAARDEWFKLYDVSHPPEHVPVEGLRGLYCVMTSLDAKSYESCYCPGVPWNPRALTP